MNSNIISFNVPNIITIGIMGMIFFTVAFLGAQAYHAATGS